MCRVWFDAQGQDFWGKEAEEQQREEESVGHKWFKRLSKYWSGHESSSL